MSNRKIIIVIATCLGLALGFAIPNWFFFGRGGYNAEFYLRSFDESTWRANKMDGLHSPRRQMVRSLMKRLEVGMDRKTVEEILGTPDYIMLGWQSYRIGHPHWSAFAIDHDVFEIRYEKERLIEMRVRST